MIGNAKSEDKIHLLEYIIIKLAKWQIDTNKWDLETFNKLNNFSHHKILLFPYYMASANGKHTQRQMFSFYNTFFARAYGYGEQDIEFHLSKENRIGDSITLVNDGTKIQLDLSTVSTDIRTYLSILKSRPLGARPDVDGFSTFYELVDHSIKVYYTNEWFITDYDESVLIQNCYKHSTWRFHSMFSSLMEEPINIEKLMNEKSVYSAEISNRILV